jgi:hypothetical protein
MSQEQPVIIQMSEEDIAAIYDRRLQLIEKVWGSATAYDTAITIGGYGAFFALWAGVAEDVSSVARVTTAALMGVSLFLYIGWQILNMLVRHRHDAEFSAAAMKAQPALDAINEWDQIEVRKTKAMIAVHRYWQPIFGGSVMFGFAGAATLIYNCVAVAVGLPQLTGAF